MHAVSLVARALARRESAPPPEPPREGICAVTGLEGPCIPRKHLIGKSFTNLDLLAAPASDMVSVDAYLALTCKWERMSSWYCDGDSFVRLDRVGVRDMVLAGNYGKQWCGYATTSYKKHGALNAKVNMGRRAIWRYENLDVDCSGPKFLEIWARLNAELRAGIGRQVLEAVTCPPFLLKKIGVPRWVAFERWARPRAWSAQYRFACYLLPSQKELAEEAKGK